MRVCCPCAVLDHPGLPDIAAGLPTLPRQLAGFAEYRLAMLRDIPLHAPLSRWRAREGDDLGIMLLEMWAYVLDILGFYDERIANETYLRTAVHRPSVRKLVELIGYQPRPALAASVVLAAIADGNRLVKLPPRTGFRSDAFGAEPPQVFETEIEHSIHRLKNKWTLAAVREATLSKPLLLEPDTARLTRDQIVLLSWPLEFTVTNARTWPEAFDPAAGTVEPGLPFLIPPENFRRAVLDLFKNARFHRRIDVRNPPPAGSRLRFMNLVAGTVADARTMESIDGASYLRLEVSPSPSIPSHVRLTDITVSSLNLTASLFPTAQPDPGDISTTLLLDAIYSEIKVGDLIVVSRGAQFRPVVVLSTTIDQVNFPGAADTKVPISSLEVAPKLPSDWVASGLLRLYFRVADGGKLTRVGKVRLNVADFAPPGLVIDGIVEQIPELVVKPSQLLLLDAQDNGALANGSVDIDARGEGKVQLGADTTPFDPALRTPITVFANLVRATRGETVFNELLGGGDASQAFQSFTLGNQPLTYINDPAAPNGRRSTLEVRVNGIKWQEMLSFFGTGPEDEVYIVRHGDEGEAVITFGNGLTGARLPTGVDNVTATYRFGAGAARPPAGAIGQLANPVEGLRRVVNPVAAGGGADADQPKGIRRNAPHSALILGRAVSVADFEALAREFGGVVNAHVEWAWDESCQRAVVMVCFISNGGEIAKDLRAFLLGQADPTTPVVAVQAKARPSQLVMDLEIDPRFSGPTVAQQVRQALTNPDTGILALQNIPIGRPLFRSRIFDAVLSVEGTRSVRTMTVDGLPVPFALTVEPGWYRDFLAGLVVGTSAA